MPTSTWPKSHSASGMHRTQRCDSVADRERRGRPVDATPGCRGHPAGRAGCQVRAAPASNPSPTTRRAVSWFSCCRRSGTYWSASMNRLPGGDAESVDEPGAGEERERVNRASPASRRPSSPVARSRQGGRGVSAGRSSCSIAATSGRVWTARPVMPEDRRRLTPATGPRSTVSNRARGPGRTSRPSRAVPARHHPCPRRGQRRPDRCRTSAPARSAGETAIVTRGRRPSAAAQTTASRRGGLGWASDGVEDMHPGRDHVLLLGARHRQRRASSPAAAALSTANPPARPLGVPRQAIEADMQRKTSFGRPTGSVPSSFRWITPPGQSSLAGRTRCASSCRSSASATPPQRCSRAGATPIRSARPPSSRVRLRATTVRLGGA